MDQYKTAKGTKDSFPTDENLRQHTISVCESILRLCDAQRIDTPVFELKSVLLQGCGDESTKQIYELKPENEDGEQLALRFDQTMPWSRYVKSNGITKMRRYQIGKVYRRDQPNMGNRRYREFYQCDFDILGNDCVKEAVDAECISILNRILKELKLTKDYTILVNSREILGAIFDHCKIQGNLFLTVCSSIDKLDKKGWIYVANELQTKGLTIEQTKNMEDIFKQFKGSGGDLLSLEWMPVDLINRFSKFWKYLDIFGCSDKVKLDISLARGLDYYTGMIFEVQLKKSKIGSVAAGGRYDILCNAIDCVGFSVGIDRLTSAVPPVPKRDQNVDIRLISPNSYDPSDPNIAIKVFEYRMHVLKKLRDCNIKVGTELRLDCNMGTQINKTIKADIPFIGFIGVREMENQTINLKNLSKRVEEELSIDAACKKILEVTTLSKQ